MNINPLIDDKHMMVEKSVRFEENVLFRPIEHQRDMTAEHRDQLWYNVRNIEPLCTWPDRGNGGHPSELAFSLSAAA